MPKAASSPQESLIGYPEGNRAYFEGFFKIRATFKRGYRGYIKGFPLGVPFWGPNKKDCSIWESILGPLILGNYHLRIDCMEGLRTISASHR